MPDKGRASLTEPVLEAKFLEELRSQLGYESKDIPTDYIRYKCTGGFGYIYIVKQRYDLDSEDFSPRELILKVTTTERVRALCLAESPENVPEKADQIIEQLVDEAKKLKDLRHNCIVRYFDSFSVSGPHGISHGLLMNYCSGGTLQDKIDDAMARQEPTRISEVKIKRWFLQLALALEYAHSKDIIHLDLKPANVYIMANDHDDMVKLGDFNLSVVNSTGLSSACLLSLGEPFYFSPERLNDQEPSKSDDVWSFGVCLHYTAALQRPFQGTKYTVGAAILSGQRRSLLDYGCSPSLADLVDHLLVLDKNQRLVDMENVILDPYFQADSNLEDTYVRCPANLWNYIEKRSQKKGLPVINSLSDSSSIELGLHIWLDMVKNAHLELERNFNRWLHEMSDLMSLYKEAAEAIGGCKTKADIAKIVGASTSLAGAGLGVAGIVMSVLSGGILSPVGIGLIISGASVGLAGTATAGTAAAVEYFLKKKEIKAARAKEGPAGEAEKALQESADKLRDLMPETEFLEAIETEVPETAKIKMAEIEKAALIARTVLRGGNIAADVVQFAVRPAAAAVATKVNYFLLPLGAILDIYTIIQAAYDIHKDNSAEVGNVIHQLCETLMAREEPTKEYMKAIMKTVRKKLETAANLPRLGDSKVTMVSHGARGDFVPVV